MENTITIKLPIVSNPYGIACFEDFMAEATRQYNEEKDLKNAAFGFLVSKGLYDEFHAYLHSPDTNKGDNMADRIACALDYKEQADDSKQ